MIVLLPNKSSLPQFRPTYNKLLEIVEKAASEDPESQLKATREFMQQLSLLMKEDPPIDENIEVSIIRRIVEFLGRHNHPQLQLEAAMVLVKVVSGTSGHKQVAIEHNAIPLFVQLLESNCSDVREQAVRALGHIAADSPEHRNYVLDSGALMPLLDILSNYNSELSILRVAAHSLLIFCHVRPTPYEQLKAALPCLRSLIRKEDAEVVKAACQTLSSLSYGPEDLIQEVIKAGVCLRLVVLLKDSSYEILKPVVQTLGNIVPSYDAETRLALIEILLPHLYEILAPEQDKSVIEIACRTISKITAGSTAQMQLAIIEQLLPHLYKLLAPKQDSSIIEVACWTISKISARSTAQMQLEIVRALMTKAESMTLEPKRVFIQKGVIPMIMQFLRSDDIDVKEQAIRALKTIVDNSPECTEDVLDSGALKPLLNILREHSELSMLSVAAKTLLKFCHVKPTPYGQLKPTLQVLRNLISKKDADAEIVTDACQALYSLSNGPNDLIQAMVEADVYGQLEKLLKDSSPEILKPVLRTLGNIITGYDAEKQSDIIEELLPHLYKLLASKQDNSITEAACRTISKITAGSSTAQMQVVKKLTKVASKASEHKRVVIREAVIPMIKRLLGSDGIDAKKQLNPTLGVLRSVISEKDVDAEIVTAACQALSSLSNGPNDQIRAMVEADVYGQLLKLLKDSSPEILKSVLGTLGNIITGYDAKKQSDIIEELLPHLYKLLASKQDNSITEVACRTISKITAGSSTAQMQAVKKLTKVASKASEHKRVVIREAVIPMIKRLLGSDGTDAKKQLNPTLGVLRSVISEKDVDTEIVTAACQALSSLSNGPNEQIRAMVEADVYGQLLKLLKDSSLEILKPVLRTLGNIITGYDAKKQSDIIEELLPHLYKLLASKQDNSITKVACRTISKITAGSSTAQMQTIKKLTKVASKTLEHKRVVFREAVIPMIKRLLRSNSIDTKKQLKPALQALWSLISQKDADADVEIVTAACQALFSLSNGPNDLIQAMVEADVYKQLVKLLKDSSPEILKPVLRTLGNIISHYDAEKQSKIIEELHHLYELLASKQDNSIIEVARQTISKITASSTAQMQVQVRANDQKKLCRTCKRVEDSM